MKGIYKIQNKINGKVYVGQSIDIEFRWYSHIHDLESNSHRNQHLQNSWNKYGSNNFEFSIIEETDEDKLTEREQYWIDYYGGIDSENTYNHKGAGNKGAVSDETKQKLREAAIGKPAWNKGLTADSDERVANYAKSLSEYKIPEEMKQRISKTVKSLHEAGHYDYAEMTRKRIETMKKNGTVRKDKGIKRGKRDPEIGKRISEAKRRSNARKRELGLPLRNQEKKPIPMKVSICVVCGKEFKQRRCHYKKTCSVDCKCKLLSMIQRGEFVNE